MSFGGLQRTEPVEKALVFLPAWESFGLAIAAKSAENSSPSFLPAGKSDEVFPDCNEFVPCEPPLKYSGLHGRRGVHHEILCAVVQEERSDWQALTAATLHNAPLRIIAGGGGQAAMTEQELDRAHIRSALQEMNREGVPPIPHAE